MSIYDQVEIEDMDFFADQGKLYYPCPCGDRFVITLDELRRGLDIARCPSCSLIIQVIFDEASVTQLVALQQELLA